MCGSDSDHENFGLRSGHFFGFKSEFLVESWSECLVEVSNGLAQPGWEVKFWVGFVDLNFYLIQWRSISG